MLQNKNLIFDLFIRKIRKITIAQNVQSKTTDRHKRII